MIWVCDNDILPHRENFFNWLVFKTLWCTKSHVNCEEPLIYDLNYQMPPDDVSSDANIMLSKLQYCKIHPECAYRYILPKQVKFYNWSIGSVIVCFSCNSTTSSLCTNTIYGMSVKYSHAVQQHFGYKIDSYYCNSKHAHTKLFSYLSHCRAPLITTLSLLCASYILP